MAISVPIVSEFIDKGVKNANQAFKNLQQNVKAADTTMGKFKAVTETASGYINANFLPLVGAAGGALVTFGAKAVTEFQNIALAAGKLSDATGLAVDDASRYMEVLGDIGIDAGNLETSLSKLGRAAAGESDSFKELGAQIEYTKSGGVDINETFINVIDQLNKINDPAKRAKLATELLGKGWQGMAELIGMGADDLRASLAGVSDAKIIDAAEVKKARDFRAAMDDLKDAVDDVTLVIGSTLVPYLTDLARQTKQVMDVKVGGKSITDYMTAIGTTAFDQVNPLARLTDTMSGVARITGENNSVMERGYGVLETTLSVVPVVGDAFSALGNAIFGSTKEVKDFSKVGAQLWGIIKTNMTNPVDDLAERALPNVTYAWDSFMGTLKREDQYAAVRDALDGIYEKLNMVFAGEAVDTAEYEAAVRRAQQLLGELVATTLEAGQITSAEANAILFTVKTGDLEYAAALLRDIRLLTDQSNVSMKTGTTYIPGLGTFPAMANGGVVTSPTMALIGEAGPEAVVPLDRMGGMGSTINITVTSADPNEVVRAIQRWTRDNGAVPMTTTTAIRR